MIETYFYPGCTSWFITPPLSLPNTSYLVLVASCDQPSCQLEVNGTFNRYLV